LGSALGNGPTRGVTLTVGPRKVARVGLAVSNDQNLWMALGPVT